MTRPRADGAAPNAGMPASRRSAAPSPHPSGDTAASGPTPARDLPAQDLAEGFGAQMARWARELGCDEPAVQALHAAARLASLSTSDGHACVELADVAQAMSLPVPALRERLLATPLVGTPAAPTARPLVLDEGDRLYLGRYFDLERRLAAALHRRAAPREVPAAARPALQALLDRLFADNAARLGQAPDWQRLAVGLALQRRLLVVSGGPGTGKTTTVVALLACLLTMQPGLRIALAAPTGKAAARMQEAIRDRAGNLPPELRERLPATSYTIHRLLGVTSDAGRFRHHRDHPLPVDVLIVDEASMLDLALATRLIEALPDDARLVLLGDKDQLSAVEAGAVFAELSGDPGLTDACIEALAALCGTPAARIVPAPAVRPSSLHDGVVWFTESHRFRADSGIGRLARDVNAGRGDAALDWIAQGGDAALRWLDDGGPTLSSPAAAAIESGYAEYLATLRRLRDAATDTDCAMPPAEAFAAFDRFRVLCATREGPRGVAGINTRVARWLRGALDHPLDTGDASAWYPGRAVIVQRNDPVLKLYNGDVGLCLPDAQGRLMVWFPDGAQGFRAVAPVRLPEHDTAFAITVHKSQGSEFASVLMVLPATDVRVATRELVYTGITRASRAVTLVGGREVFVAACRRVTQRRSGLLARLAQAGRDPPAG